MAVVHDEGAARAQLDVVAFPLGLERLNARTPHMAASQRALGQATFAATRTPPVAWRETKQAGGASPLVSALMSQMATDMNSTIIILLSTTVTIIRNMHVG